MVNSLGGKLSFNIDASDSVSVEIKKNESIVFGTMTITNDGDDPLGVALLITHDSPWKVVESFSDRDEEIIFYGIFSGTQPAVDDFDKHDIISTTTKRIAFANTFANASDNKEVKGYDIGKDEHRNLFFRIDAPSTTEHMDKGYSFNINATIFSSVKTSKKIGIGGGTLEIPNRIILYIPPGAVKGPTDIAVLRKNVLLLSKGNGSAKNYTPVCAYQFFPAGLAFKIPVTVEMSYFEDTIPEGEEDNLKVFYWDGFEWRYIGGELDKEKKSVIARLVHFSVYAILPVKKVLPIRPAEKIITPALHDSINDVATFDGLAGQAVDINIYDITGRKVRTIDILAEGNSWDGGDGHGNIVESGVYIYQFEYNAKMYSGTIVVAK